MAKEPAPLAQPTMYDPPALPAQARPMLPVGETAMRMQSKIVTAQKVALPRSESRVMQDMVQAANAAGEKYFYSIPYGGKGGGAMVMGPSVKLASDAARKWGNCEVNCEFVSETDTHFVFEGVFIDYETGYVLRRPYLQRKDQDVGIRDRARALDQVFQIAASKATRNVILRAIPEICDAAYDAARTGLVNKVGANPDAYRQKIAAFLEKIEVPLARVEKLYGKPLGKMTNADLAKLATQCTSVHENMIDADECWPADEIDAKPAALAKPKASESATKGEQKAAKPGPKNAEKKAAPAPEPEPEVADVPADEPAPEAAAEEAPTGEDTPVEEETPAAEEPAEEGGGLDLKFD